MWKRKAGDTKWELVSDPGQGDSKMAVADYVKAQESHTMTIVSQRHSLMMKHVVTKVARLVADVQRHTKHLASLVATFQADPSSGASKVCILLLPHLCFAQLVITCSDTFPVIVSMTSTLPFSFCYARVLNVIQQTRLEVCLFLNRLPRQQR